MPASAGTLFCAGRKQVTAFHFDWPQSATSLLALAKQQTDLVKLIMDGNTHIESWLIEHAILPALGAKQLKTLCFALAGAEPHTAAMVPLPDGSAFARSTLGTWFALEASEAAHEIQYLGGRFAPGNHWQSGFSASLQPADGAAPQLLTPAEVARQWLESTGLPLTGFEAGILDQVEALGMDLLDKAFNTRGRLGL